MSLDIRKLLLLKKISQNFLKKKKIINNLSEYNLHEFVKQIVINENNLGAQANKLPISTIILFSGKNIPVNWLLCDGSLLIINDYPELFNLISNIYGGNGQNNFMLPNLIEKITIGKSNSYPLGFYGGENNHVISVDELPSHNHIGKTDNNGLHNHTGITSIIGDHIHNTNSQDYCLIHKSVGGNNTITKNLEENLGLVYLITNPLNLDVHPGGSHNHSITEDGGHNHTFTTNNIGSNLPINLMQSFVAINYLIKVK